MPRPNRASRRSRGPRSGRPHNGFTIDRVVSVPAGPNIRSASVDDVLAAISRVSAPEDWPAIALSLVPIFQRLRPYDGAFPDALRTVVPPGISISFAVDIGPALLHVTPTIAAAWDVGLEAITERALANVTTLAAAVPADLVFHSTVGDVLVAALQSGSGGASTFVLVPEVLPRLFGPEPRLFIAPMRDLLLALPADVDREFALWVHAEFAVQDPNCLAPIGFLVRDGTVSLEVLEPEFATA